MSYRVIGSAVMGFTPRVIGAAAISIAGLAPPDAPTALSATAISASQIDLSWTDNSANETGFKVQRATSSGGPYTLITTTAADATSYGDTGLDGDTTYYYVVAATNAAGDSANSNEATATTPSNALADILINDYGALFVTTWYLDTTGSTATAQPTTYNGTYNGPTLAQRAVPFSEGDAPAFDGINDSIDGLAAALQANVDADECAFMVLFYSNNTQNFRTLFDWSNPAGTERVLLYHNRLSVVGSVTTIGIVAPNVANQWRTYYVESSNTDGVSLIVDGGTPQTAAAAGVLNQANMNSFFVGRDLGGATAQYWGGNIAMIVGWSGNANLPTPAEVTAIDALMRGL